MLPALPRTDSAPERRGSAGERRPTLGQPRLISRNLAQSRAASGRRGDASRGEEGATAARRRPWQRRRGSGDLIPPAQQRGLISPHLALISRCPPRGASRQPPAQRRLAPPHREGRLARAHRRRRRHRPLSCYPRMTTAAASASAAAATAAAAAVADTSAAADPTALAASLRLGPNVACLRLVRPQLRRPCFVGASASAVPRQRGRQLRRRAELRRRGQLGRPQPRPRRRGCRGAERERGRRGGEGRTILFPPTRGERRRRRRPEIQ